MNVLVIEDSAPTRDLLVRALGSESWTVETASRFSSGVKLAMTERHDIILLDLMLPDGDGLDLCRRLRAEGITVPVLCLTARDEVAERVRGLDAGADDYLKKPFALAELRARIRALTRRQGVSPPVRIDSGGIRIDFTARRLERAGQEVTLTAREWAVLEALASKQGRVVRRADLLDSIWHGAGRPASDSLDVILSRIRRKLGEGGSCAIRTVRGEGYVFEVSP
jgi:two-component system, OmpR family, response regulator